MYMPMDHGRYNGMELIRIKEFVIAPVKWPYYFITTRFIVNQLIKRGYVARKVVEKEVKYLRKKDALKKQAKSKRLHGLDGQ